MRLKTKPIKWGFKLVLMWLYYLGKRAKTEFSLGESVILSLSESLKNSHCYLFFDNFFTSRKLMLKLLENGIYGIETIKANRKCIPFLKADKQMSSRNVCYPAHFFIGSKEIQ